MWRTNTHSYKLGLKTSSNPLVLRYNNQTNAVKLWRSSFVEENLTDKGKKFFYQTSKVDLHMYIRCHENDSISCDGGYFINPTSGYFHGTDSHDEMTAYRLLQLLKKGNLICGTQRNTQKDVEIGTCLSMMQATVILRVTKRQTSSRVLVHDAVHCS